MALGGIMNAASVENKPGGILFGVGGGGSGGGYAFGSSPLESLRAGLQQGASKTNAAVGAAQSGVNAVLAGGGQVQSSIAGMNQQAQNVIQQGNKVNQTADLVKGTYDKLSPVAALLGDYGTTMWNEGRGLSDRANGLYGQGDALMSLDPNAGGIVGEFVKYWQSLSPDRYVSQAESDTQASFQNAGAQMMRDMSRRGVNVSSGAYVNLKKQTGIALATALAAAKTKAREYGLDRQAAQLDKMMAAANQMYGVANQTEGEALSAMNAGASAQAQGAGITANQASGYAQVAQLQANAGQLFGSAASIMGNAGQLQISYGNSVQSAYANLASAQQAAANYYLSAVGQEVSAVNGGGGGGGGMRVSSPPDEWSKVSSGRDTSQSGSPWTTTWTNGKAVVTGDAFFNPNK